MLHIPGAPSGRRVGGQMSVMVHSSFAPKTLVPALASISPVRDVTAAGCCYIRSRGSCRRISVGTGLLLCFRDNGAAHTLNVNGRRIDTQTGDNDATCRELGATTTLRTGDLDFALHSVVLEVNASDDSEFEFYGGILQTRVAVDRYGFTPIQSGICSAVAATATLRQRSQSTTGIRTGLWSVKEATRCGIRSYSVLRCSDRAGSGMSSKTLGQSTAQAPLSVLMGPA